MKTDYTASSSDYQTTKAIVQPEKQSSTAPDASKPIPAPAANPAMRSDVESGCLALQHRRRSAMKIVDDLIRNAMYLVWFYKPSYLFSCQVWRERFAVMSHANGS
jgi:hypothetical protein